MSIAINIKLLREHFGLTQDDLAKTCGVSDKAVSTWETGKNVPRMGVIQKIADTYNINKSAIIEDGGFEKFLTYPPKQSVALTTHEQTHITKYRACDERGKEMTDRILDYEYNRCVGNTKIVEFPEIKSLSLELYRDPSAAGYGNYLTEDSYHETVDFSVADVPQGTDYAVTISGDSMEPKILNGSIAFIKCCPCVDSGDIGIFLLNGESFCKKFVYDENERVIQLVSLNPDYNPIPIGPDDDLRVLGKVLGVYEED